jgi:3,4-dihydroxy 2-butanone 4-phosphate synthase / GTP cyclohydrolase II
VNPDSIESAIAAIAAGKPVVVVDDEDRENEGDLIFAAELVTPELVTFMAVHCRGLVCVPLAQADCDRLGLSQMVERNTEHQGTAFTVSVDAREGTTTGISAVDRAKTIRLLADPLTRAEALVRPGHVFPLQAKDGGVLRRRGHTEAAVDLARLAGLRPAGAICEILNDDGTMARRPALEKFVARHGLALITIADLVTYRQEFDPLAIRVSAALLPTPQGLAASIGYQDATGQVHVALVYGDLGAGEDVLVRVHSECLTGDTFGSLRCDCGAQLEQAKGAIAQEGRGVVLYVRGHEGRGIGLANKLRAYALQDLGADTVQANQDLGLPVDARQWRVAGAILHQLGIRSMRLLSNNPRKAAELKPYAPDIIARVPMGPVVTRENVRYLRTKRDRMGHDLPGLELEGEQ